VSNTEGALGRPDEYFLAHELVGDAVIVLVELHMVVDADLGLLPELP